MTYETIMKRSDDIWKWSRNKENLKNKCYEGFHEIRKLEGVLEANGMRYSTQVDDGGLTVIFEYDNGKQLAKARENCFSEGAAMDLLEVYGLYENKRKVYGFIDSSTAFSMFLNSLRIYTAVLNKAV